MSTLSQSPTPNVQALYSDYAAAIETYIMFRIARRTVELTPALEAKGRAPIKMSIGAPTVDPPKALLDKFKQFLDEPGIHTYSVPEGEAFFRTAIADRMKTRFGVSVDAKTEVCSLLGSKEGLANIFRGIITPRPNLTEQDIILTPDPGYASYVDAIRVAGGHSYPIPLTPENRYLPDYEAYFNQLPQQGLDPKRVKALIINYPSNPIGATAPLSYYENLIAFARKHNILVISDLAYSEMYFSGEEPPHSILEATGAKDIAIEFHSFSKPYAITGWRLGFAVGNADAVGILSRIKSTMDSGIFKAAQKACAFALSSPECEQFIREMNQVYEAKQQKMIAGFKALGWPMDELSPPRATFYLWLPTPSRYATAEAFTNDLMETSGVVAVPGTAFGKGGEGFMRLSLVNPDAELDEVLCRMKEDGFIF